MSLNHILLSPARTEIRNCFNNVHIQDLPSWLYKSDALGGICVKPLGNERVNNLWNDLFVMVSNTLNIEQK